jgi:hypothetical protein
MVGVATVAAGQEQQRRMYNTWPMLVLCIHA